MPSDRPSLGQHTAEVMISAAERLFDAIARERTRDLLSVGVGIHIGLASVGDVVNTAARLQSAALAGQIVVSDEIYSRAAGHCPQAAAVALVLKGKSELFRAHVIQTNPRAA